MMMVFQQKPTESHEMRPVGIGPIWRRGLPGGSGAE